MFCSLMMSMAVTGCAKMLNGGEAATILATFLVLVLAADGASEALRRRMA